MSDKQLLAYILIMMCFLSSCVYDRGWGLCFRNCTNDTLVIGWSYSYDNIDSVDCQLEPHVPHTDSTLYNTKSLWKRIDVGIEAICPDSMGMDGITFPPSNLDTLYFFLVKYSDAKKYSLDEIRDRKLFRKFVTAKNKDGRFDRNIRYVE